MFMNNIDGQWVPGRSVSRNINPSDTNDLIGEYARADTAQVEAAIAAAKAALPGWAASTPQLRFDLLDGVGAELLRRRQELGELLSREEGKTLAEGIGEVTRAGYVFKFFAGEALRLGGERVASLRPGVEVEITREPVGVIGIITPWNFPIAIPCGGVAAALAAGNTVILKPASDAVLVAWEFCKCFWRAGVSKKVLQFVPCSGGQEGRKLINHPKVSSVILTGGTETALTMLRDNPRLNLFAETGGKDATIVTAVSDRDQAIKHILHSAFSHAGQKCSATSLLLLQNEVYDDPAFRRGLCEAVQSMKVGSAWELDTKMGPLIRPPGGDLETALKVLEPGEEWALMPQPVEGNPCLWTPGIKYGVRPGSFTHLTEFFGPVLAVMRFETLSEAVALVNQTGFGLTSGLESLDEREWDYWKQHIRAGNLYINRVTTGAIVLRQPFGGMGKSVFGAGMKAGGPNYVAQLMDFTDGTPVKVSRSNLPALPTVGTLCVGLLAKKHPEADRIVAAALSCEAALRDEFGKEHDHFLLVGQDNARRYLPCENVRVRVHAGDSAFDIFTRIIAAHIAGCGVTVSAPVDLKSPALTLLEELTESWAGAIEFVVETDEQLAAAIRGKQTDRVRYASPDRAPVPVLQAGGEAGGCVIGMPVTGEGRLEMLWYLHEQSISTDYHRYGNLGVRADEKRAAVL